MFRKVFTTLVATFVLICITAGSLSADDKFDKLCHDVLESLQSFYPVRSTEMGIHAYDFHLADYSSKSVKSMIKKLQGYEKKLFRYKKADLPRHDRINYKLVKANVDIALLNLQRIQWHRKSPQLYVDEAINGIYFLLLSGHAPLHEKRVAIVSRMKAVPGLLATARKRLKKPPPVYIEAALESLESGQQFYREVAGELMSKFPDQADEILQASTRAREAMNDFALYLSELEPGSPTEFAIGRKNFDYKLSHEYFLTYGSDSLLKLGEALLEQSQVAYAEQEAYLENHHQNGQDSVFVPAHFSGADILEYYNWEVRQVQVFLERSDFVTIPEDIAPVTVIETPPFLRTMISSIAYQPAGPFDSVQHGYFYVRPVPEDIDRQQLEARYRYIHRRGFRSSVVHEAFPGHHLQLQLAGRNEDPVRKWQFNIMMIEGWALYCEEEVYHHGLYSSEDPVQWLGTLGGIRFRAARIVADVKLHTGQFSYQECVDWMIDALGITSESGRQYIRTEVRRYTLSPAYQMSYLIGKLAIMELREAAMARDGDAFSLAGFHDALLAEGSIPPALMWEAMGL